jgi:hypothetical protein
MPRGYDRPIYILPFDHRGSFRTKLFGWKPPLSEPQTAEIAAAKRVIYDEFRAASRRHSASTPGIATIEILLLSQEHPFLGNTANGKERSCVPFGSRPSAIPPFFN